MLFQEGEVFRVPGFEVDDFRPEVAVEFAGAAAAAGAFESVGMIGSCTSQAVEVESAAAKGVGFDAGVVGFGVPFDRNDKEFRDV